MSSLHVNGLDLAVAIVLLVSAVLAFMRGFVQETLSIGAWVGASLGAMYGLRYVHPLARRIIPLDWAADAAGAIVLFLAILFVLSIATNLAARKVQRSSLNPLDRSLGFLFGLVRGAVFVSVAMIIGDWLIVHDSRPEWMRSAKTLPLLESGAGLLKAMVPHTVAEADGTAKEAIAKVNEAVEAKKTLDRLTVPVPISVGKNDKDAQSATGNVEDLIGQKVQEIDRTSGASK